MPDCENLEKYYQEGQSHCKEDRWENHYTNNEIGNAKFILRVLLLQYDPKSP